MREGRNLLRPPALPSGGAQLVATAYSPPYDYSTFTAQFTAGRLHVAVP